MLTRWKRRAKQWQEQPYSGTLTLLVGMLLCTVCIWGIDTLLGVLPNPGLIYLPLVGMLAYHWGVRQAFAATLLQLLCVYVFFLPPPLALKSFTPQNMVQLVALAAVTGFVLALVQLARHGRATALRAAARLAALNRVGRALTGELEETRLLHLIAEIAYDLTGAEFAAFVLRSADAPGPSAPPSQEGRFSPAGVVGVTSEQEHLLRQMPLHGEGLFAPIFRQGGLCASRMPRLC